MKVFWKWKGGAELENYESIFYEKIKNIEDDSGRVVIVNAGSIDSGKTFLFNELLNNGETFNIGYRKVADRIQIENWHDDIFLIDTPVLPAMQFNVNTIHAYNQASAIIYVHNIEKDRLNFDEIESILKVTDDKKFFWNRFCLVLTTFKNSAKEYIEKILHNVIDQIRREFNVEKFPAFIISTDKHSISKMRVWIEMNLPRWKYAKIRRSQELFAQLKEEIIKQITDEQTRIQSRIAQTISEVKSQQNNFRRDVEDMYAEIQGMQGIN